MKRFHVHLGVQDLAESIRFYSALFAAEPTVVKDDYVKWMLDDPRINLAISTRSGRPGADHLGMQAETQDELREVYGRLQRAGRPVLEEGEMVCCYAQSEKAWISDPQGIPWEAFLTSGDSTVYGFDADLEPIRAGSGGACCVPVGEPEPKKACCGPSGQARP
jgi:catechol 2,3-dioxygenase-like lactoylglutathione lyase family enzyme